MNSSGGTVDAAPLVEKFDSFSLGADPSSTHGGPNNNTGSGPTTTTNTTSPPRGGTAGGGPWSMSLSASSSNRAPALTASTMSTYDDRGSTCLSVSTSNLNGGPSVGSQGTITPTPTGSPSGNKSCAYSRSSAGSMAGGGGILGGGSGYGSNNPSGTSMNITGGSSASLGLGDGRPSSSSAGGGHHHHHHHHPNQGTVPTSIGNYSSADSLAASPLVFDVSPSSSSDAYRSGGYSSSLIASTGGHRRIISTESSAGNGGMGGMMGAPPPPPTLERGSSSQSHSHDVDAASTFLSGSSVGSGSHGFSHRYGSGGGGGGGNGTLDAGAESFAIAPRPFGSAASSQTSGGSEDGLRGLDALANGRERAQTMPNGDHPIHAEQQQQQQPSAYGSSSLSSSSAHHHHPHHRTWSTADQHFGGGGGGGGGATTSSITSASSTSRLLSSSEPPKASSFLGSGAGGGGGRPPLATSKTNLSDLDRDSSFDYLQHPPQPGSYGTLPVQQQRSASTGGSTGSQDYALRGSIDAYSSSSEYAMPEDRPVHGGEAYVPAGRSTSVGGTATSGTTSSFGGGSPRSTMLPPPLNQHARSYSQGSAPMPMTTPSSSSGGHGGGGHQPSGAGSGTPLYSVSVRERFATSDGIDEHPHQHQHQHQAQYAAPSYDSAGGSGGRVQYGTAAAGGAAGGVPSQHQQVLPRSVSTGSNIVMYTDGREFSSMRRSDSAPGHIVSSSVPSSYQHYQDPSVHGGSRFSANRTPTMYGQPQQQQQQQHHPHHHQQPQQQNAYHAVDEYHEPIVLPQYGVATMPRPPAAAAMGPGPKIVYHVQFKRSHRYFVLGPRAPRDIEVGTFVKVEADRGEDLGKIVDLLSAEHFNANCRNLPTAGAGYGGEGQGSGPSCAADLKRVTRRASKEEVDLLPLKGEEENELINICGDKVRQRGLPMRIIDAEYQFDRHKLTFFFESDCRVDFRELVRDLFSIYKTRIWMEQLN